MNKICDGRFIYICTKLFNYNDKLQAEYLESSLRNRLNCNVFMPFRDTDENKLTGSSRTKIIYDSDIEMLNSGKVILLAVLYDGICKDEGISFEIGYAYGKEIPIFIINTDFIWYAIENKEFLFDPIVEKMCSDYLHQYQIIENGSFYDSLMLSQKGVFDLAAEKISNLLGAKKVFQSSISKENMMYDVFVDLGGGKYEYQREYAKWIKEKLTSMNISVKVSNRYSRIEQTSAIEDLRNLLNSTYYVCLGDEVELNSGTAALLGLARCKRKKIILYESSNIEIHGENGHCMKKNLMIDFSVDKVAKTKKQIIDIIAEEGKCLKN